MLIESHALALKQLSLALVAAGGRARAATSLRVDHAVPRHIGVGGKGGHRVADLPRVAAQSGQHRDLSVRGDAPLRDAPGDVVDPFPRYRSHAPISSLLTARESHPSPDRSVTQVTNAVDGAYCDGARTATSFPV